MRPVKHDPVRFTTSPPAVYPNVWLMLVTEGPLQTARAVFDRFGPSVAPARTTRAMAAVARSRADGLRKMLMMLAPLCASQETDALRIAESRQTYWPFGAVSMRDL